MAPSWVGLHCLREALVKPCGIATVTIPDNFPSYSRKLSLIRSTDHFSRDEKLSMDQNKAEDWFQVLLLLLYESLLHT